MKFLCVALLSFYLYGLELGDIRIIAANSHNSINLPAYSYFTDSTPIIDNERNIAFNFFAVDGGNVVQGILLDTKSKRGHARVILSDNQIINHLNFSSNGLMFSTHDGAEFVGIYKTSFNGALNDYSKLLLPEDNYLYVNFASSSLSKKLVLRLNNYKKRSLGVLSLSDIRTFSIEGVNRINYVFNPKMSGDYALYKLRYGRLGEYTNEDLEELRVFNLEKGTHKVILNNQAAFSRLENLYNINKNGSFVAFAKRGSDKVIVSDVSGQKEVILNIENHKFIKSVDLFSPAINNVGEVLVRGVNRSGKKCLFLYSLTKWHEVICEDFAITQQNTVYQLSKSSGGQLFKGGVSLNDHREIVFNTYLKSSGSTHEGIVYIKVK